MTIWKRLLRTIFVFGINLILASALLAADSRAVLVNQIAMFPDAIRESSGLAAYGGYLWTINDSGAGPVVHKLDKSGALIASIELPDIENIDWESLAGDSSYLYIADTGNNTNRRSTLTIYRVAWSELESPSPTIDQIDFRYGDYQSGNMFRHNFDSEGLTVRDNELWLFTKNRGDLNTNLYRFPKIPGSYAPEPSQTLEVDSLITAADIHPVTGELVLIGNRRGQNDILWRAPTNNEGVDWDAAKGQVIGPIDQWEAALWGVEDQKIWLTHESNTRGYAGLATLND